MATEATCKNPECGKKFKRKNSKKIYCNLSCKNRGNYLLNQEKDARDILWNKGYEMNKKILIDLFLRNILRVSFEALGYMGFDFHCLKEKKYKGKELTYYIVGEFFLINDGPEHVCLQPINK